MLPRRKDKTGHFSDHRLFRSKPVTCGLVGPSASACELYRERIEADVRRCRNTMASWQDLVDQHGFVGGIRASGNLSAECGELAVRSSSDDRTVPGKECRLDYDTGRMVLDAASGRYRHTPPFVLTLGYSRKSVRLQVFRPSSRVWAQLHEQAFRRPGGVPRINVVDNLREGVRAPDVTTLA
jgi:hypothetical protein